LRSVELSRLGDWTIVGFSAGQNPVFSNLVGRVQSGRTPSETPATNAWLQTTVDLRRASRALSWGLDLPEDWPQVSLSVTGNGQNVLTHGVLAFSKPLPFQIEPWRIPTNLVHEPLHSFTAVQGVKQWSSSWSWWQNLHAGAAPNQLFFWGQRGSPFLDYAAAPADARHVMAKLGPAIMDSLNPLLATSRMGKWERATNSDGVEWRAPAVAPFVQSIAVKEGNYLLCGLSPFGLTNGPPTLGTFKELLSQPNLVYYEREITGPRVDAWLYISQIFRIISRRAQLPLGAVIEWLKAVGPMLGNSTTMLTKTAPDTISISRTATLGLTGFEIHLLCDWLESSEFPGRPHSQVAKLPPPSRLPRTKAEPRPGNK
jgi:hypothetical protein